eukprot:3313629-Rhodomonas_salina.2
MREAALASAMVFYVQVLSSCLLSVVQLQPCEAAVFSDRPSSQVVLDLVAAEPASAPGLRMRKVSSCIANARPLHSECIVHEWGCYPIARVRAHALHNVAVDDLMHLVAARQLEVRTRVAGRCARVETCADQVGVAFLTAIWSSVQP